MSAQSEFKLNSEVGRASVAGRRRALRGLSGLALAAGLAGAMLIPASAQTIPAQNNPDIEEQQLNIPSPGLDPSFQEHRIEALNVERQKEMVSDTDKLVKLTAQLNADVAKNHSTSLTPDQLRLLARIEKLAKSVREKMSNPVQGTIFERSFPSVMMPEPIP